MKNTKILYMFRDNNNLKTENEEIVKGEMSKEQIERIKSSLLDGEYFYPEQVGLTERRFGEYDANDMLFELDDIVITQEDPTIDLTAEELAANFVRNRGKWEKYRAGKFLRVRVEGGWLTASITTDPRFPGIDVEFVPDIEDDERASNPRVLIEKPKGEPLRAYVWDCTTQEDYTHRVDFGG